MKKIKESEMLQIHGGAGYFWRCSCGYKSAWHAFRHTAQANADAHTRIYGSGHVTAVYYA